MKRFAAIMAVLAFGIVPATSRAVVGVGEDAKLTYQTVDGKTIDLQKLHGKMVIVDFWATWCGPCMNEANHMVQINKTWGPKGLQMLGVSLDADKQAMLTISKQKGFTWPQYFDGQGWNNKLWKQWGSNGIPFTVLIAPDGKVLWTGHPAAIDQQLERAFKEHPPFLVDPKVVAEANKTLDLIEKKIDAQDAKGAIKLLSKIPAGVKSDTEFAARSAEVQKKLEASASAMLAEVDPLIEKNQYPEAVTKLKQLSDALAGLPVGVTARKKLADLMSKPEAKAAVAAAEKNAKADDALAVAQKLKTDKKDELAYARFKDVAREFSGTDAAATAADEVKNYETEKPAMVKKLSDSAATGKAKAALSMAESYKKSGRTELARTKYKSVIDQYPGTSYAELAKKELANLGNE